MKTIPGYQNYEADEEGNIWVTKSNRNDLKNRLPHKMKSKLTASGYLAVTVTADADGLRHKHNVHRLVALAFHGQPPSPIHQAAHNDGDRFNNKPSNLEWKTPSQNTLDRTRHGTTLIGSAHPQAKLNELQVLSIRERLRIGDSHHKLAAIFEVSKRTIDFIAHRRTWTHI